MFNFNPSQDDLNSYSNILCTSNALLYSFFQLTSLLLNLCLCFDLIMTIYSPFSPAYRRTKIYYLISVVGPLMVILFIWAISSAEERESDSNLCLAYAYTNAATQIMPQASLVLAMCLSLYIVVAIYSTVYSYRRLHRPGVSAPVRAMFVRKHFLYVVVFIIIWMIQQSANYFRLFNPEINNIPNDSDIEMNSVRMGAQPTHHIDYLAAYLGLRPSRAN